MAARSLSVGVAAAGLLAAAALVLTGGSSVVALVGPTRADVESVRQELDSKLREVAAGVHARATTLADLPRLQAAVSTDAATVRDLTQDELAFRSAPGEVIEIAQVKKAGGVDTLWRSSEGQAPVPPLDQSGLHLLLADGQLHLAEVDDVVPRARADELRGAIGLSRLVDLGQVKAKVEALGVPAWLTVGGQRLELGKPRSDAPNMEVMVVPLQSDAGHGATLGVQLPPVRPAATNGVRRGIAAGVALLALVIAGLLWGRPSNNAGGVSAGEQTPAAEAFSATGKTAIGPTTGIQPRLSSTGTSTLDRGPTSGIEPAADGVQRVGRYEIVRPLGSGGMADVYLARVLGEAGFEKQVALKVLHRSMARQPMVVDHFLDEARLASRLVHPNIVQISDLGRAGDEYFIAMEYVEGSDLERLLTAARGKGEPVPQKVAFTIVRRILDGLQAAHTAVTAEGKPLELVHRDVKAANVFISRNGAVKIGDFGIAKANQESRVARTEIGQVKGTAAYMAPEHRIGQAVDARADLYSAGAIAYEVFTGQEINLDLVKIAHLGRQGWPHLPLPTSVRSDLPPELDVLIFKALAYEKDDRFTSCEAFEEALAQLADAKGLTASDKAVAQWVAGEIESDPTLRSASLTGTGGGGRTNNS